LRESSLSAATIDATSQNAADDDPILDMLEQESLEAILLSHFRDVVWMQLLPAGGIFNFAGGSSLDADVFDREATNFPPVRFTIPWPTWSNYFLAFLTFFFFFFFES
jgi:hypothetical protein